ncbi:malate/citrate symporter [Spiroplasma clarkii]|nr:2-hydroxycarboxylate transporter family protein [Spiroplasma clarkii]ARU92254.1 malate/citrate symporter [Spiroplasma clarkii]
MVGVGIIYIHLDEFIKALNPEALFISFLFVLGATVGPMLFAKMFKFNAVESAVSAGLCMTAQGGSGAIAVLGASERMNLMPFGQITCRIAGSMILIFAAIAFAQWPPEGNEIVTNLGGVL